MYNKVEMSTKKFSFQLLVISNLVFHLPNERDIKKNILKEHPHTMTSDFRLNLMKSDLSWSLKF